MAWAHRIPTTADISKLENWHRYVPGQDNSSLSYTSDKATYLLELVPGQLPGGSDDWSQTRWSLSWGVPDAVRVLGRVGRDCYYSTREDAVAAAAEHHAGLPAYR